MHIVGDGPDVVDASGLIVHAHDRHEDGILTQRLFYLFQMHGTVRMKRQVSDLKAEHLLQLSSRAHDAGVLCAAGDDVSAPLLIGKGKPFQGIVVRFARAGSEHDLPGLDMEKLCDVRTARFQQWLHFAARLMQRVRIRIIGLQDLFIRLKHFLTDRRRRCVIKIDHRHAAWFMMPGSFDLISFS